MRARVTFADPNTIDAGIYGCTSPDLHWTGTDVNEFDRWLCVEEGLGTLHGARKIEVDGELSYCGIDVVELV